MKVQAAFSAPVRGQAGDSVGKIEKQTNIDRGRGMGHTIQDAFSDVLHLHIPHDHETIIEYVVKHLDDYVMVSNTGSGVIVNAYCDLVADQDLLIVYTGHGISGGMKAEIQSAEDTGVEIFEFDDWNDHTKERLARVIAELIERE